MEFMGICHMRKLLLASITTTLLPLAAFAQSSSLPTVTPPSSSGGLGLATSNLDPADARFLKLASAAGLAEVQDGQIAETKGSPAVQKIGATMVTDHTKANAQLKALALRMGVQVPPAVTTHAAATSTALQGLSGPAFDSEYLKTQKQAHLRAIALFNTESTTGSDADLKAFAAQTLPTLQMHLQMIEAAQK
jgi:putative membrane protein